MAKSTIIMAEAILEREVLVALCEGRKDQGEEFYFSSTWLHDRTGVNLLLVRAILRNLTDNGLVSYCRGLMTEDGNVAGSGYAATMAGVDRLKRVG